MTCFYILVNVKGMTSRLVFVLQMDAEAADKMLHTCSKGTKGELASRFHDMVPTTPSNVQVPEFSP